ncbi:DUF397 domain-containing protein [Actinocorallia aurantiaca]
MDFSRAQWRKSSHSGGDHGMCVELAEVTVQWCESGHSSQEGGECVGLAGLPSAVGVRDSKNPQGPRLVVSRSAFGSLVGGIKRG